MGKRGPSARSEYALYKGDEFIDIGTAEKLSAKYGFTPGTIRFYASASYMREERSKRPNAVVCVNLGKEGRYE
jgi:hypothetical protein